jgi:hypothetical protein
MHKISQTIEHGSMVVKLTVRGATGWDKYEERVLFRRLYTMVTGNATYTGDDFMTVKIQALSDYTSLVTRTVLAEGLPIPFPTPESDDKALCAGFEYLREIPIKVYEQWLKLLEKADEPPGDPDLFPPDNLTDGQKKAKE